MKNSGILSAVLGGAFFAVPYLGLSVGIIPSLAIGAGGYLASELIFHASKKEVNYNPLNPYEIIKEAKTKNEAIMKMIPKIEDNDMKRNIREIVETVNKMVETVEKKPAMMKKMGNFFDYYLPVTYNILNKYDEIENQRLNTKESKKYMKSTQDMIVKINEAFKNQLANLYQSDMVDADAEMKVFESMLKADGYGDMSDFDMKDKEE